MVQTVTTAISNSFLRPNKNNPKDADSIVSGIILGDFLFYIHNGMLCALNEVILMRHTTYHHVTETEKDCP